MPEGAELRPQSLLIHRVLIALDLALGNLRHHRRLRTPRTNTGHATKLERNDVALVCAVNGTLGNSRQHRHGGAQRARTWSTRFLAATDAVTPWPFFIASSSDLISARTAAAGSVRPPHPTPPTPSRRVRRGRLRKTQSSSAHVRATATTAARTTSRKATAGRTGSSDDSVGVLRGKSDALDVGHARVPLGHHGVEVLLRKAIARVDHDGLCGRSHLCPCPRRRAFGCDVLCQRALAPTCPPPSPRAHSVGCWTCGAKRSTCRLATRTASARSGSALASATPCSAVVRRTHPRTPPGTACRARGVSKKEGHATVLAASQPGQK